MAFSKSNVELYNQVGGGRSSGPTIYSVHYNGPLSDWTTGVNIELKAWILSIGANVGDGLFLRSSDEGNGGHLGVIFTVDATKIGFARCEVTRPT